MSISNGPNLGLMENANTGEAHDAALRALLRGIDGLVQPNVKGYLTNTPPGSPANGDCYIIGAAPTGAWAGQGGKVTRYSTVATAWEFYTPKNGWMLEANSARESYRYTGSAWEIFYQEGTWTPSIQGSTTPGTQTYTTQFGNYVRIGRSVTAKFRLIMSAKDGATAGNARVAGLPFTSDATAGSQSAATIGAVSNITLAAGSALVGAVIQGESVITLYEFQSGAPAAALTAAGISNSTAIGGAATYFI